MGAFCRGLITKAEFKMLRVQETNTVMKWKTDVCSLLHFLLTIFFLLKWDFLWNHLVSQNVMINIFLTTQPPKTSD